jgi:hypothetical protein
MTEITVSPRSFSEIRTACMDEDKHSFWMFLPLYILAETRPKPNEPAHVEIACLQYCGRTFMQPFLSPIDAMIYRYYATKAGYRYEVRVFEEISPQPFILKQGCFQLYIVYGFAARENRVLFGKDGSALPLGKPFELDIPPEAMPHFHVDLDTDWIDELNSLHRRADMADYSSIVMDDMASAPRREVVQHAQDAFSQLEKPGKQIVKDPKDITHCALYDPLLQRWRFSPLNPPKHEKQLLS